MNEVVNAFEEFIDNLPLYREAMIHDARTMKNYGTAKRYVKEFKHDVGASYYPTPEEQIMSAFNTLIEETVTQLSKDADKAEIKEK